MINQELISGNNMNLIPKLIEEKTVSFNELENGIKIAPFSDWYVTYAEYGTPVLKQDGYYNSNHDFISQFINRTSQTMKYSESHSKTISVQVSASSGVSVDATALNSKFNGSLGVNLTKSSTVDKTVTMDNVPPKYGFNIYACYRRFSVPTYSVTQYSASMGGGKDSRYVGETIVYVPSGILTSDVVKYLN